MKTKPGVWVWGLLALALAGCGGPKDPNLGLWGGKLDDEFPIFLYVEPGPDAGDYRVGCYWQLDLESAEYLQSRDAAKASEGHVVGRFYIFRTDGKTGVIHGGFGPPRAGNLVKLKGDMPPLPGEADRALQKAGWMPAEISPEDAQARITEP